MCYGIRRIYYAKCADQMVENLIQVMILENVQEKSKDFSILVNQLVVSIGTDKSNNDFTPMLQLYNCKKDNAEVYVHF